MRPVQGVGIGCALASSIVDQASKAIAISMGPRLEAGIEVLPVFNLVLVRNRGVSFGLLANLPWWALAITGLLAVAGLSVWLWRTDRKLDAAAIGLDSGQAFLLAGAGLVSGAVQAADRCGMTRAALQRILARLGIARLPAE